MRLLTLYKQQCEQKGVEMKQHLVVYACRGLLPYCIATPGMTPQLVRIYKFLREVGLGCSQISFFTRVIVTSRAVNNCEPPERVCVSAGTGLDDYGAERPENSE